MALAWLLAVGWGGVWGTKVGRRISRKEAWVVDDQITQGLMILIFQIALLSGTIKLSIDNVRAAIEDPSHYPEITLALSVVVCFLFDFGSLTVIMQGPARDMFGIVPGAWFDYVITGLAIAGGAGKFADMVKKAAQRKDEAHKAKVSGQDVSQ